MEKLLEGQLSSSHLRLGIKADKRCSSEPQLAWPHLRTPSQALPKTEGAAGSAGRKFYNFVLRQQGTSFPAGYLNSSPASKILWFGHGVKYKLKIPTSAWPWKASQLSSPGMNCLISLLTRKQSSSSELG